MQKLEWSLSLAALPLGDNIFELMELRELCKVGKLEP